MFDLEFRVDYADTDAMAVVHHANYFKYFEKARIAWLREQGLPYSTMEEQGLMLPLKTVSCKYVKPLRFDDLVTIRVKLEDLGKATVELVYEVIRDGEIVATGHTHHVLCRKNTDGKFIPTRIPDEWRQKPEWQPLKL